MPIIEEVDVVQEIAVPPPPTLYEKVVISADFVRHALTLAAFPLLTGLYGYRGVNNKPLKASKYEVQATKRFNVSLETLNEYYSALIPVGFLYTKMTANSLGIISFVWTTMVGLVKEEVPSMIKLIETTGVIGDAVTWLSGATAFSALGIWTYRRQQRRKRDPKLFIVGAPEVSLAVFLAEFISLQVYPTNAFVKGFINQKPDFN